MIEQELIIKINKIRKKRLLTRVAILAALFIVVILNVMLDINIKYLGVAYILFSIAIIVFIGLPTQKKLGEYEAQLKKVV